MIPRIVDDRSAIDRGRAQAVRFLAVGAPNDRGAIVDDEPPERRFPVLLDVAVRGV